MAEFGVVHRYEPSGALHGLLRVRAFTQDDAHVFCTEAQMAEECLKINDLILSTYADFGFEEVVVKLSTRPEKRVGSDEAWDEAEAIMTRVLSDIEAGSGGRIKTGINPGEGAFYGPKFEYTLRDAIGREWQCGTTQVDFNLPSRFGAYYIGPDSEKKTPVMIHRAIFGSLERFTGILIEHFAGHLPLWLSPLQIVICTITQDADDYAYEVAAAARKLGLVVEVDARNEKITYKVREHSLAKVPVLLVAGKKEAAERTISMRRLGSQAQTQLAARRGVEAAGGGSDAAGSAGLVIARADAGRNPSPLGRRWRAKRGTGEGKSPYTRQALSPQPSRFARHLLPMGEGRTAFFGGEIGAEMLYVCPGRADPTALERLHDKRPHFSEAQRGDGVHPAVPDETFFLVLGKLAERLGEERGDAIFRHSPATTSIAKTSHMRERIYSSACEFEDDVEQGFGIAVEHRRHHPMRSIRNAVADQGVDVVPRNAQQTRQRSIGGFFAPLAQQEEDEEKGRRTIPFFAGGGEVFLDLIKKEGGHLRPTRGSGAQRPAWQVFIGGELFENRARVHCRLLTVPH